MGRKSSLTPEQWADIEKRLIDGAESRRSIAKEYGISEGAIRFKLAERVEKIKTVTNQLVVAHQGLQSLPLAAQVTAQSNAAKLLSLSNHMISAAEYGAATAHRLSAIAHMKVAEVDDAGPMTEDNMATLKGIAALTRMANESSEIGMNLIRANKEQMADVGKTENKVKSGLSHFYGDDETDAEPGSQGLLEDQS